MDNLIKEIFKQNYPQAYQCDVWQYQVGLSELLIRLYIPQEDGVNANTFEYLIFQGVLFFEGPLKWKGGLLVAGSREECLEILQQIDIKNPLDAVDTGFYKLFKFRTSTFEIRIIATKVIAK